MELKELEDSLKAYYGKHQSDYVQDTTMEYISGNYTDKEYKSLLRAIMKSHPYNYGFPDVAAIEEAQDKLWKKEGKSLRKSNTTGEWKDLSKPLTEEERKTAKEEHDKFLAFSKQLSMGKTDKKEKKYCKDCISFSATKNTYVCIWCTDFSNYKSKHTQSTH